MLIASNSRLAKTGARNSHFEYDAGQAFANFVVQATHLGLSVHQMAGFDREGAVRVAGFKQPSGSGPDWEAVTMAVVGYWDESGQGLPAEMKAGEAHPKDRKPLENIVSAGKFSG